jgi:cell division transport system permease protein
VSRVSDALTLLRGDVAADQVVPPSGRIANLTLLATAAMSFLAVMALVLALTAQRVAGQWTDALASVSTVELAGADDAGVARLITVLETTPGVTRVVEVDADRQRALLEPWLGPDFPTEALGLPRLVELHTTAEFDPETLALRLQGELPEAVFVPRSELQESVAAAAARLRWIGWVALVLTGLVTAAIITLAATAALAANARVIATLRLLGARDSFVARAFVRRFTIRGAIGAAAGTLLAVLVLVAFSVSGVKAALPLMPGAFGWVAIALVPMLAAAIGFAATRRAALRTLSHLT